MSIQSLLKALKKESTLIFLFQFDYGVFILFFFLNETNKTGKQLGQLDIYSKYLFQVWLERRIHFWQSKKVELYDMNNINNLVFMILVNTIIQF